MIYPSFNQLDELAEDFNLIPISREIYADVITPITLLRKLSAESDRYFLLQSVEGGERWGRYSFLGFDPLIHMSCKNGQVTTCQNGRRTVETVHPMDAVRRVLAQHKSPKLPDMPPFTGGLVGSFGYNMIGYAEPMLTLAEGEFNDFDLMLFDKVIAYDHLKQKIVVIVNMDAKAEDLRFSYGEALDEIDRIVAKILDPKPLPIAVTASRPEFTCNVSKEEYCALVERTKEYIVDGDIFQAVISRRFESDYKDSLLNAYRVLRTTNPSPYMVFMQSGDVELMCSSPETLVKLQNGRLTTFPVAGSRPRGKSKEADELLAHELMEDQKELAEHNMLVDLARNDLGKVSRIGSVEVTEDKAIHRYSKIMHITSVVEGDLKEGLDACDAIEAILPAGTLSGAPKIRACQIIQEMEGAPRGIYGGAIGYIDLSGNMDTCIAIRMAVKKGDKVTVQAGGGIVADSVPETEYEESANKAGAVMNAILLAPEVDD